MPRPGGNRRTDRYGGGTEGRMRLPNEVLDAVCAVGPSRRFGWAGEAEDLPAVHHRLSGPRPAGLSVVRGPGSEHA
ncbi:hypothetical protein ACFYY8_17785 [Streptosporangium sp. NPDC001559]|uniref:hypothetical protein n=1 Tax=Streptosporangium sp. NPDC001559 TaxID=3366187 RepID=UPI0036F0EA38